jgi:hypothetical protein
MFEYLNHDNRWPRFRRFGLEVDPETGALTLRRLPGPPRTIGCVPGAQAPAPAAAGIAAGPDGALYFSDPGGNRVFRLAPESTIAAPLGCTDSQGPPWELGRFNRPLGLTVQSCRNRLLVADSGNRRIQVIDPATEQVVGVWGQTWPYSEPRPCAVEGGLDCPEQLAEDTAGGVYVIDHLDSTPDAGWRRLVKFDADGRLDHGFTTAVEHPMRAAPDRERFDPRYVAVSRWRDAGATGREDRVLVLGVVVRQSAKNGDAPMVEAWLCVFTPDGRPLLGGPLPLLPKADADPAATDPAVVGVVPGPQFGVPADPGAALRGFAALGTMLFAGVAGSGGAGGGSPEEQDPDRVWCFEIGDALRAGTPGPVEPSWLPLYDQPVAALGVRGEGELADLLIQAGPGRPVVALRHRGAFRTQGAFLAGPFAGYRGRATPWHRVRMIGELPAGGRASFFTLSRGAEPTPWSAPPRPRLDRLPAWFRPETYADMLRRLGLAPGTEIPPPEPAERPVNPPRRPGEAGPRRDPGRTAPGAWFAAPDGQIDFLAQNDGGTPLDPADQLWILGLVAGDGMTSPRFVQGRLEYDEDGWLADLPDYYRRDSRSQIFLRSVLALFESGFEGVTEAIDRLPGLFSPEVVAGAYGRDSAELGWLAGCLALALPPRRLRTGRAVRLLGEGPGWLARRGTPDGLRRLVWLETGAEVHVDEPGAGDDPWVIGESAEGEGAALAPAAPDGTILGRDTLGHAALGDPDGPPLTLAADLAHHFVVRGYAADLADPAARAAVAGAVRRAAPAHATYSVQVIEPRLRVGVQARLGIDAVVAAGHPADPLTLGLPPGPESQIAPTPATAPAVGTAHLGSDTTLT